MKISLIPFLSKTPRIDANTKIISFLPGMSHDDDNDDDDEYDDDDNDDDDDAVGWSEHRWRKTVVLLA